MLLLPPFLKYIINLIVISRIHSKPINIWWIRTGSHPYDNIMSSIVLYSVFYEYKNVQS